MMVWMKFHACIDACGIFENEWLGWVGTLLYTIPSNETMALLIELNSFKINRTTIF